MTKKKKKKHNKVVLLTKTKLHICHDNFVNNVLREYDDMKEEIKNLKT